MTTTQTLTEDQVRTELVHARKQLASWKRSRELGHGRIRSIAYWEKRVRELGNDLRIRPAAEGDTFRLTVQSRVTKFTVGPKCEEKAGRWICLTHLGAYLANQLQKDIHVHKGRHRLAWVCNVHGPEVP